MTFRKVAEADDRVFLQAASKVSIASVDDIHRACGSGGDLTAARAYIAAAKDVNVTNGQGQTPLHMAALFGRDRIAEALLAAGADCAAKWQGMTALDMARVNKHPKCVGLLAPRIEKLNAAIRAKNAAADPSTIDLWEAVEIGDSVAITRAGAAAGVDLDVRNGDEETPLHKAVLYDHLPEQVGVVTALIKAGCDKNAKRDGGWTALHLAAEHGHDECAKVLIKAGADTEARGRNGMTALDIARHCGNARIRKMLEGAKGAKGAKGY